MMDQNRLGLEATNQSPEPAIPTSPSHSAVAPVDDGIEDLTGVNGQSVASRAFSRRRRSHKKKTSDDQIKKKDKSRSRKKLPKEELDPYDSDPGESYRDHCLRIKGISNKTCLRRPGFLKAPDDNADDTVATDPPSPISELEDSLNQTPASLPQGVDPVRYSLRTSIGDGTAKQPDGPSVMERRELRPNNVHVNVSHWSDMGCRPYMEDR